MKKVILALITIVLAAGIMLAAQNRKAMVDPSWVVPEKAARQQNPLKDKPEAAAGGRKMFTRYCAQCHGDEKRARTNKAPDLGAEEVQQESDGALFWRISNGNSSKGMPAFSSLPEGVRWQLVMHIRTIGK